MHYKFAKGLKLHLSQLRLNFQSASKHAQMDISGNRLMEIDSPMSPVLRRGSSVGIITSERALYFIPNYYVIDLGTLIIKPTRAHERAHP
jgi:hypothetical protein